MAARIVAWHLVEASRFFAALALSPEQVKAEALDAWLIAQCREAGTDTVSTRDISRLGPNAVRHADARDKALTILGDAGRIRLESDGKRKRVRINPALIES